MDTLFRRPSNRSLPISCTFLPWYRWPFPTRSSWRFRRKTVVRTTSRWPTRNSPNLCPRTPSTWAPSRFSRTARYCIPIVFSSFLPSNNSPTPRQPSRSRNWLVLWRKRSMTIIVYVIINWYQYPLTFSASCSKWPRDPTSISGSWRLWCRPVWWTAGSKVYSSTPATVCSGTSAAGRRSSSGCTVSPSPCVLPGAAISWPSLFQSPTTLSAPWRPVDGRRRTAPRCPPCTCSTRTRSFRRCLWPGILCSAPRKLDPAERKAWIVLSYVVISLSRHVMRSTVFFFLYFLHPFQPARFCAAWYIYIYITCYLEYSRQ